MNTNRQETQSIDQDREQQVDGDASAPLALVTGGSSGLGFALVSALAERGYRVITDARSAEALSAAAANWPATVRTVPGDVTDPEHRAELHRVLTQLTAGSSTTAHLDLLVNNASTLGVSPLAPLEQVRSEVLTDTWLTNVTAPLALIQTFGPELRAAGGAVINISSDAAVEHYPTWGPYAASKAALDHLSGTLAAELDGQVAVYAVDPGDMRTPMHQAAFPGEDISDRPLPQESVPGLLELVRRRPASGRYRAADFTPSPALRTTTPADHSTRSEITS